MITAEMIAQEIVTGSVLVIGLPTECAWDDALPLGSCLVASVFELAGEGFATLRVQAQPSDPGFDSVEATDTQGLFFVRSLSEVAEDLKFAAQLLQD